MPILYHLTFLPPKMPECVAELQEVTTLRDHFGGETIYINPNQRSPIYIPRLLFGFQKLKTLRQIEYDYDLHHIYNADAFAFPILKQLRKPIVYSVSGGIGRKRPNMRFLDSLAAVVVADERSLKRLQGWGSKNCMLVHPGIDTSRFHYTPTPLNKEIYLMVGSAPWTIAQFQTKGVNALLEAAKQNPHLHLIFLWRGVLDSEMEQRVQSLNLEKQVQIIKQRVDVNQILSQVHASITLAAAPGIVKAYPHSLLESLAAGKPVLISQGIPMSDYVAHKQCGQIVRTVTAQAILEALDELLEKYPAMQTKAQQVGKNDFSLDKLITTFDRVYKKVLNGDHI